MLRTKVTIVFALLVVVFTAAGIFAVRLDAGDALEEALAAQVSQGVNMAESELRLRQASLLSRAEFAAGSESIFVAMKAAQEAPDDTKPELSFEERRHLAVHEKLTAERYKLDDIRKLGHVAGARAERPNNVEIFMVLDDDGKGVAALGKDLFSWFGQDVAQSHPGVKAVLDTGMSRVEYWTWAFGKKEMGVYQVAIAPIHADDSHKLVGVVVVGEALDDSVALTLRKLVAGLPADAPTTDPRLKIAPHVVISHGDKLAGSSFDSSWIKGVHEELNLGEAELGVTKKIEVRDTEFLAMGREMGSEGENSVRFFVAGDSSAALSPMTAITVNLTILGLIFLLIGVGVLLAIIVGFVRQIDEIEAGMQEVIAGNKDFVWAADGHELKNSLAQSLNLMSAFLQGKRMPDEEVAEGWTETMDGLGGSAGGAAPKVQGVDLGMMQSLPPKKNDDQ